MEVIKFSVVTTSCLEYGMSGRSSDKNNLKIQIEINHLYI